MHEYMEQDVRLTAHLYQTMRPWEWSERSIELEHDIAWITESIGNAGWTLDQKKASELYAELAQRRQELDGELQDLFEPWETTEVFNPKRDNKTKGYVAGEPFTKRKTIYFNYNSRRQIEFCLRRKYGWEPEKLTADGHAQIDDVVLGNLPYPEAKKLAEVFLIQKRIGQLAEGKQAWLKKVDKDGRLRHRIISGGCISGRASHVGPNLAQVPATRLKYGKQCRELFQCSQATWLVPTAGLELRLPASYKTGASMPRKSLVATSIQQTRRRQASRPETRQRPLSTPSSSAAVTPSSDRWWELVLAKAGSFDPTSLKTYLRLRSSRGS